MRKIVITLLCSVLIFSCQITDENAPKPDEAFIKYYGNLTNHTASDIEIIYDAAGVEPEGFVVFGTKTSSRGDTDYFIFSTDLEGNLLDSISFGLSDTLDLVDNDTEAPFPDGKADDWTGDGFVDRFRANEIGGQIEVIDGGFAFVGTSSITISALGVSDYQWLTFGFINRDFEPITFQGDTLLALTSPSDDQYDLIGNDIIQLQDGSFLIVGAEELGSGSNTDFDNYYTKLDFDAGFIFDLNQGVAGNGRDDVLTRAFEKDNGNLVMIGTSNTPSLLGENGGNNGDNVFYLETDPNGTPVISVAYGIDDPDNVVVYNDEVTDAIKTTSGYTIVGTSSTSQNQEFSFIMNLSNDGQHLSSNSHDSSAFNTNSITLQSKGGGVTQGDDSDLILLGQYQNFRIDGGSRGDEGMFVRFNESAVPVQGAESFFGLSDGNDDVVDAVTLPDGKIVAVSNVDFGGGVRLISIIKLNDDGSLD